MKYTKTISLVAILALVAGCTPTSDSIVRRVTPAGDEVPTTLPEAVPAGAVTRLDEGTRTVVKRYGPVIKDYARTYGFDWRLILAVMKQESRFSSHAMSHRGAFGLMQIMPVTAEEVTRSLSLQDIVHPRNNIRGEIGRASCRERV